MQFYQYYMSNLHAQRLYHFVFSPTIYVPASSQPCQWSVLQKLGFLLILQVRDDILGHFHFVFLLWAKLSTQLVHKNFHGTGLFIRRRRWHPTPVLLPGKSHGRRSLWAAVHGVSKSQTRLSDFTFTFHFHALEKEMATHSSVLAWRIPGMGEPVGLQSMEFHRVGHDWSDLAAAAAMVKNLPATAGDIRDVGAILWSGRSPGAGHGNPLQYSCLKNPIDRGAWWATVHRVTKSQTQLKWLDTHMYIR